MLLATQAAIAGTIIFSGLFGFSALSPDRIAAESYAVQSGDTTFTIATRIGIPVDLLLALNPKVESPDLIFIGQLLTVPNGSDLNAAPPPATGTPAPDTTAPASAELVHTVQPGDALSTIAALYGVSTDYLIALNPSLNPDVILIGSAIVVLSQGGAATTAPTANHGATSNDDPDIVPYRVQPGDTYSDIAARFGLSQAQLFALNPTIPPNAVLVSSAFVFVPAKAFLAFQVGQPVPAHSDDHASGSTEPETPKTIYVVQPGDTAIVIAQLRGITLPQLLSLNPSIDPNLLSIGQVIVVPDVPPDPAQVEAQPGGPTIYTVQEGDTLGDIAARSGLTIDQLLALNPSINPDLITPGTTLLLPVPPPSPVSSSTFITETGDFLEYIAAAAGVLPETLIANNPGLDLSGIIPAGTILNVPDIEGFQITVQAGDTLAAIAAIHGSTVDAILADPHNAGLNHAALVIGQQILVPVATPVFLWPVAGAISDPFGVCRADCTQRHNAIDIASLESTDVTAITGGVVAFVGGSVCCGLGLYIEIDHGNGWVSRYAHLSFLGTVAEGEFVAPGQVIATAGCTGLCTGTHLHLELEHNGWLLDPLNYLP